MVIKVRIFRREDAKYEIEVEVAPGFTFEEMVWLFETVYREVIWCPRYGGGYSLLTLFSPPHCRVTNRWMHGAVYHGWTEKDCEQTSAAENNFQENLHCPICDVGLVDQDCEHQFFGISMEGHSWDTGSERDCVDCQKESQGRMFVESWNPAQILLAPIRYPEIEVEPGLSYFEMHDLLKASYMEALQRGQQVRLYSPPHNRLTSGRCRRG
ncbi:uncharacterized protein LOC122801681 [Protopterus annectens]|uniref:uncharacterized protein LOC122801681 n=1 Tax=Protopterus annectens TaxID=7888 RepID=UPI001CFB6AAE|nr:uncharacterized protein LOC122801681 [Protopterus annectens]